MKVIINNILSTIVLACFLFFAIGSVDDDSSSSSSKSSKSNSTSSSSSSLKESNPDVCKCLIEPGNTKWAKANRYTCRDAISDRIGVSNWEQVNFSQNPTLDARWSRLQANCGY